jgi:hypothetical protein
MPFTGSGTVVNLSFSKRADLAGKLTYITASYTDRQGSQHSMETSILYAPIKEDETGGGKGTGGTGGKSGATQLPAQDGGHEAAQSAADVSDTAANDRRESRPRSYKKAESVLERFRNYAGERTFPAMKALFERKDTLGISQEPAVALSDGKTPVRVTIRGEAASGGAPLFALKNAELIFLKTPDSGGWVLELMPARGKYEALLTVFADTAITEYPLAIAPALADLSVAESATLPAYVRDYIETANSIVAASSPAADH